MKQSQWIVAAAVMAGMVFAVTFAMNYLGGTNDPAPDVKIDETPVGKGGYLDFPERLFPPVSETKGMALLERELNVKGHADFWFRNPTEYAVRVGLDNRNCRCTSVSLHVLKAEDVGRAASDAAGLVGAAAAGAIPAGLFRAAAEVAFATSVPGTELLEKDGTTVNVGGGAVGWVRLSYNPDKPGLQRLVAKLWMDSESQGRTAELQMALYFHEPLRVVPSLSLGTVREEDLGTGLSGDIVVWSSTRNALDLKANLSFVRKGPGGEPLTVGAPVPLDPEARRALAVANNAAGAGHESNRGSVLCAYRIPVTLRAKDAEGRKALDLGRFVRHVVVSIPEDDHQHAPGQAHYHGHHEKVIPVTGTVRGLVEIGTEDAGGEVLFGTFPRAKGKTTKVYITSSVEGLVLSFDRERTPAYFNAKVTPLKALTAGKLRWLVEMEALKDVIWGTFPRRDDPAYADSAFYLKATLPDSPSGPPRTIRLAATGTATER